MKTILVRKGEPRNQIPTGYEILKAHRAKEERMKKNLSKQIVTWNISKGMEVADDRIRLKKLI